MVFPQTSILSSVSFLHCTICDSLNTHQFNSPFVAHTVHSSGISVSTLSSQGFHRQIPKLSSKSQQSRNQLKMNKMSPKY